MIQNKCELSPMETSKTGTTDLFTVLPKPNNINNNNNDESLRPVVTLSDSNINEFVMIPADSEISSFTRTVDTSPESTSIGNSPISFPIGTSNDSITSMNFITDSNMNSSITIPPDPISHISISSINIPIAAIDTSNCAYIISASNTNSYSSINQSTDSEDEYINVID